MAYALKTAVATVLAVIASSMLFDFLDELFGLEAIARGLAREVRA